MIGYYDYRLVALSVLIAICAAYSALDLAARTTAASGQHRLAWLAGGAIAMGFGIWSMHYIGMLAFSLPMAVLYDWPTVLLSLLAAIFASGVALFVVSSREISRMSVLLGSAIMGGGISAMHYTGMSAMRIAAMCSYKPFLFALSIVLAVVVSLIALWLTFQFRNEKRRPAWLKVGSAIIMGSAIPIMHYTGMAAARFVPSKVQPDLSHAVSTSTLGFTGVSVVTLLISGVAILTSAFDRRFSAQRMQLAASERRYQLLLDGVKDYAIFMLDPAGKIVSWNLGAERIHGYKAEEILGSDFSNFYIEDDCKANKPFKCLTQAAEQGRVEDQGWRVCKDGSHFWADVVITAVWDNGKLQGFSKVVRDITERKRAEESIRELSARLLQLQDEERRQIARELHDSAGQMIAAVNMNLAPLAEDGLRTPEALKVIKECLGLLEQLSSEIRTISHLLHPPLLDDVGLTSALRLYVQGFSERSRVHVDFEIANDFGRLSRDMETSIFRIIQESLTNIHRHSGSKTATIRIWRYKGEVRVQVQDLGRGFSLRSTVDVNTKTGVGIRGMQERVRQVGGIFEISAGPEGKGTTISIRLPCPSTRH